MILLKDWDMEAITVESLTSYPSILGRKGKNTASKSFWRNTCTEGIT